MISTTIESVGIDVSSQELHVWFRKDEKDGIHKIFKNDQQGIEALVNGLADHGVRGQQIVMESTGRYHGVCAVKLYESGLNVSVINPLLAKKYQKASIRKTKTDKADAKLLAEIACKEKNLIPFTQSLESLRIRQKISTLKSFEKSLQRMEASLRNLKEVSEKTEIILSKEEEMLMTSVKQMRAQKERLAKELTKEMKKNKHYGRNIELLSSIPGVSEFMASLAVFFYSLEKGEDSGQWVAYTGMDISILESGNWKGHGKLVKRGNKYLRKRWYSSAWGATMHSAEFRAYYDDLKSHGRKHTEALNIIARKLIRISFSILKKQQLYSPASCFC